MMKKLLAMGIAVVMIAVCLTGCGARKSAGGWEVTQNFSYKDIASWGSMQTPSDGSGAGTIASTNDADGYVTIKAAADGWGGVESEYFEIDLSKEPIILAQIFDDFKDIYGEKSKIKIWIYPAGGPEGTVSVSEIVVVNTKE